MFAFAGIVVFHKSGDYRVQRFDMLKAKAAERCRKQEWISDIPPRGSFEVDGPDEGLIGI